MIASARRNLHVAQGAQRGADLPLKAGSTCVIGSSPAQCSVVLSDEGVAARHCALTLDARGRVTCTALEAPVRVGQRDLPPGASMAMPDFLPLRCGRATLLVGPENADWSFSMAAAESAPGLWQRTGDGLKRRGGSNQAAAAGLLLASTLLVAGSVWGAASWLATPLRTPQDSFAQVQRWLQSVAPSASELQVIADESRQRLVVSGYVATERQREALVAALARRSDAPQAEVVSVEQMLASVARIAQDQGLRCEAAYRGAGRAACSNPFDDAAAAERLRAAASAQVAGLRELSLPAVAPAAAPVAKAGRGFAVLMSNRRGSQLIGPAGERWREGESFGGMTIRRIEFDQIVFEHDRSEIVLALAQLK